MIWFCVFGDISTFRKIDLQEKHFIHGGLIVIETVATVVLLFP